MARVSLGHGVTATKRGRPRCGSSRAEIARSHGLARLFQHSPIFVPGDRRASARRGRLGPGYRDRLLGGMINWVQFRRNATVFEKDGKTVAALVDARLFERIPVRQGPEIGFASLGKLASRKPDPLSRVLACGHGRGVVSAVPHSDNGPGTHLASHTGHATTAVPPLRSTNLRMHTALVLRDRAARPAARPVHA